MWNFPQACGGGRRSEVAVPVENRHDDFPPHIFLVWLHAPLGFTHFVQVPGELWTEIGPLLQLQQTRKAKEVWPALRLWEGGSFYTCHTFSLTINIKWAGDPVPCTVYCEQQNSPAGCFLLLRPSPWPCLCSPLQACLDRIMQASYKKNVLPTWNSLRHDMAAQWHEKYVEHMESVHNGQEHAG